MKKFCKIFIILLVISMLVAACGNKSAVESEIIGTFSGSSDLFARSINFRANGTYYEVHVSILGTLENSGTYEIKGDSVILTDRDGDVYEWTYTYNRDNGKLTLYYLDTAYTKTN